MTETGVIGLDIGTSSVKALLLGRDGRMIASGRAAYPTEQPVDGWSEQDPEDWREAAIAAVRSCLASAPVKVEALAFSGHMSAPVLVDGEGRALGPCHTIADQRAAAEAAAIPAEIVALLSARIGNLPAAHLTLPKLLWWKHHHPEIWERMRAFLMPKDWVRAWMTGDIATDPTDAGNSMLFDPVRWAWATDIAAAAGVEPFRLAPLRDPEAIAGRLLAEPARALGLPEGLPIVTGAADMAATLLGSGIDLVDDVALTIGTSATVIAGLSRIEPSLLGAMNINPTVDRGVLYAIGSHFGGGGALNWLASLLTGEAHPDPAWFGPVGAEAGAIARGAEGLTFLPYLSGAGSPDFDPAARGAFLGLSMKHGRGHMLRAIVEGVTADVAESIAMLAEVAPRRRLVVSGGGSRIPFWSALLADVTALPVVTSSAADTSAIGAALIAGIAVGWYGGSFASARRLVAPDGPVLAPADLASGAALRSRFDRARTARRPDRLSTADRDDPA